MLKVSHNALSIAQTCWQKYKWQYIDRYKPKRKPTALTLGASIHTAFEMFYKGSSDSEVIQWLTTSYDDEIANLSPEEAEDKTIEKYTVLGMWTFYPDKDLSGYEDLMVEKEFSVMLGNLRNVRFVGRVDGLIKKDGVWWVRELKTTGLTPNQFRARSDQSPQASGYVYAMRKLGYDVAGVQFDIIKKPLLRKRQSETCLDFSKRIMFDYLEDSKKPHNERKAYLRMDQYRTKVQMKHWEESAIEKTKDIREKRRHGRFTRDTSACWKYNSLCPYNKICYMDDPDKLTLELFYVTK